VPVNPDARDTVMPTLNPVTVVADTEMMIWVESTIAFPMMIGAHSAAPLSSQVIAPPPAAGG
jgi:hypothetical protein